MLMKSRFLRNGRSSLLLTLALLGFAAPAAAQEVRSASSDTLSRARPAADSGTVVASAEESAPAAVVATVVAGEEGFGLQTTDGAFALRFRGGAHYDGLFFLGEAADAAISTFQARRVRTDLVGTLYANYDFRVHVDFAGSRIELLDAYLEGRFSPALRVRAGKFKGPVGLERLQTPFTQPFPENAFPTSLVPNRDVGLQLSGALGGGVAEYALGVFNGVVDGSSEDVDGSDSKDVAARVFVHPFRKTSLGALQGLGLGVAATVGRQEGSVAAPSLPTFRTVGRQIFFRYRNTGTTDGTAIADGTRVRFAPQGYFYWKGLGVIGEYVQSRQRVALGGDAADLTHSAWEVTGSLALTGERASYRGIAAPRRPFNPGAGQWGAFELIARVHQLSIDPDAFPVFAQPTASAQRATAWAAGANWYLHRGIRVMLAYERTTTTAPEGGVERPAEQTLLTRFQVAF